VNASAGGGLRVTFEPLEKLIPYARNARQHTNEQIGQLMSSMVEWGWTNPVLADQNGIVAGHGRVIAAGRLYEQGKAIKLPSGEQVPAGTVPVIDCTGWSDTQRKAYVIADNKLALNADWDYDVLRLELNELNELKFGMDVVGFSESELGTVLNGWDSDIVPSEKDGENLDGIAVSLKVQVGKDDVDAAKQSISAALDAAGLTYELK
jgi:ParB-like chromosome segregation protein Spo0J